MKRTDLVFAALQVPLDYLALVTAGVTAYALRFNQIAGILPVADPLPYSGYVQLVWIVAAVWLGVLAIAGVYSVRRQRLTTELGRIFLGVSTAVLLVILVIFFQREFFSSRFIILAGWVLSILFLWVTHGLLRFIRWQTLKRGVGVRQAVIVGNDQVTIDLLTSLHTQPRLGLRVLRHFSTCTGEQIHELTDLFEQRAVDLVIQSDVTLPRSQTLELIDVCTEYSVPFHYAADIFDSQAARMELDEVAGMPVLVLKRTPLDGWGRILKRAFDLCLATIGVIVLAIPGLLIAALVKLDSAGPALLPLDRVGEGQKRFRLWKFRSMVRDAHALKPQLMDRNERADGPLFKISHDPRITRIGKWLRKTSIDELPQLFNVIKGDMSLVGPRPHEPEEVARYEKHHKKLLTIKPGVTGMAQISGRSNLSFEEEVRLDTFYIEHWSLGLDLQVILRTPAAVLRMKTAA